MSLQQFLKGEKHTINLGLFVSADLINSSSGTEGLSVTLEDSYP